jgi:RNA polymerase sigma-70 factor, ECF subfamily
MDDEAALVIRLAHGDDELALAELYERLSRQVFSLALQLLGSHQDAEEVLQDTFVKLYHHNGYKPELGSARAYIYSIARNEALMRLRAKRSRPIASELDFSEHQLEAATRDRDTRVLLQQAFKHLDETDAKLLNASFYQGYSHDELAEQTGLPLGTVKSRIRRALLKLRDVLGDV